MKKVSTILDKNKVTKSKSKTIKQKSPIPPIKTEQKDINIADYPNMPSQEDEVVIKKFYEDIAKQSQNIQGDWIQTYSGGKFFTCNPKPEDVNIDDIAQALSLICRFNGHSKKFISVAQHCVLVSYLCDSEFALQGLLHDASEAYISDIPSPIKQTKEFAFYREIEKRIQDCIYEKFNLPKEDHESVKIADKIALSTEAHSVLKCINKDWVLQYKPLNVHIVPLIPKLAKELFLNRFNELTNAKTKEIKK